MSQLENQVIQLRRELELLKKSQVVISDTEPRSPTTQSIWRQGDVIKWYDWKNWIDQTAGGGGMTDFSTSVVFSSTGYNNVTWSAGVINIWTESGVGTHSISSGSFTMTLNTFLYWAPDVPNGIQTTTTPQTAITSWGIIIAIAIPNSDPTAQSASIKTFGNSQSDLITADQIVANSITSNKLATALIYAWSITLSSWGAIKSGKETYADSLQWFWIWSDSGVPKLKIGNGTTQNLKWDGTNLTIVGNITASSATFGYISPGGAASDVNSNGTTISGGKITSYSIDASKINVSSLSAISADLWTVTAGTITGAVIRTQNLWRRVEINGTANSISFYDDTGTLAGSMYSPYNAWFVTPILLDGNFTVTNQFATNSATVYGNATCNGTINANGKMKLPVWTNLY